MNAPVDVTGIVIETDRLILRPWKVSDLKDFYAYAKVDGVGQMAGWMPHESIAVSRRVLDSFITERKTFALEWKENGKVIGSLGIETAPNAPEISQELMGRELGYVLAKDHWGMGLMPEAVNAVIRYCFETLGYDYLACAHFVWNDRSRRVIEKSGFVYLKDVCHETCYGTVEDTKLYILYNPNK